MVRLNSGDSGVRVRPRFGRSCTAVSPRIGERRSAHVRRWADYNQGALYGAECRIQCVGNDADNDGLLQIYVRNMDPLYAHTGT
jgi:hypothetical protein